MNFTPEQLEQFKLKVPAEIVDAIASYSFEFTVEEIGGKHNLLISETNEVYLLVIKIITGEINPATFEEKLIKALPDQDKETVHEIVREVDLEIFQKMKEHLVKSFEKKKPTDGMVGPENRDAILAEIEDPQLLPAIIPTVKPIEQKKSDIIDNKLQSTVQTTPQISNTTTQSDTSKLPQLPQTPPKTYSADPYREPLS